MAFKAKQRVGLAILPFVSALLVSAVPLGALPKHRTVRTDLINLLTQKAYLQLQRLLEERTLFGIAVETGVVMVVYLHEAMAARLAGGTPLESRDLHEATMDGAVLRLRPVLMAVFAVTFSLGPIPWETGVGSDVMVGFEYCRASPAMIRASRSLSSSRSSACT